MGKLRSFTFISIDGFYKDINNDISWHIHNEEGSEFSENQLNADSILLFGRKTFEMMSSFWPSEMARQHFPKVAEGMNKSEKIVVSKTLSDPSWNNSSVLNENAIERIAELKSIKTKDLTILGSGSLVKQLSEAGLIDEYEILIDPIILGNGTRLFSDMNSRIDLKLIENKTFKSSGSVYLKYEKR